MKAAEAKEHVWSTLDRARDEIVERCCQLIRIPSENPPGDTSAMAGHLLELFRSRGIATEVYEPKANNPNVVAHLRPFQPGARTFLFNGHMDTFPVGNPADWTVPPFGGEVRDGRIYGKGSCDMKGGLSASLSAFLTLDALDVPLAGNVIFMAVSDEETLGPWGTQWVLENHPEYRGDACLIGEANTNEGVAGAVSLGGKGILWLRLTLRGEAYHGGLCERENTINRTGRIFRVLDELYGMEGEIPEELAEVVAAARSKVMRSRTMDQIIRTVNVNVGTIQGGTKVNVVPSQTVLEVDIRLPLGWTPQRMEGLVRERLVAADLGDVKVEVMNACAPFYTPPGEPLVQVVQDNAAAIFGAVPPLRLAHATSDNRILRAFGVPVVNYGVQGPSGVADESTPAEVLVGVTKVHAATPIDLLGLR
jgi:acetylornithine deacetylase/succinyl-diaminopimelate desuccinylase-like protein